MTVSHHGAFFSGGIHIGVFLGGILFLGSACASERALELAPRLTSEQLNSTLGQECPTGSGLYCSGNSQCIQGANNQYMCVCTGGTVWCPGTTDTNGSCQANCDKPWDGDSDDDGIPDYEDSDPYGFCGNGTCEISETFASCPSDCEDNTSTPPYDGTNQPTDTDGDGLPDDGDPNPLGYCGNGICDPGETSADCPSDCYDTTQQPPYDGMVYCPDADVESPSYCASIGCNGYQADVGCVGCQNGGNNCKNDSHCSTGQTCDVDAGTTCGVCNAGPGIEDPAGGYLCSCGEVSVMCPVELDCSSSGQCVAFGSPEACN